mmetsp:Transcript_56946/g.92166  ORF Transcript_56946/g.92166 Transcript_56946/m.92166 type:complete len:91 (+) Transcript_56946:1034-1306(+)
MDRPELPVMALRSNKQKCYLPHKFRQEYLLKNGCGVSWLTMKSKKLPHHQWVRHGRRDGSSISHSPKQNPRTRNLSFESKVPEEEERICE